MGRPAVVSTAESYSGRFYTYVAGRDAYGAYWTNRLSREGAWEGWRFLGGQFAGDPAIGVEPGGDVVVAGRDRSNAYWHARLNSGPVSWTFLGGQFGSDPAMSPLGAIVGRDLWGAIWALMWRRDLANGGTFPFWFCAGGVTVGKPAVAEGQDPFLHVAVRDNYGAIWVAQFNSGARVFVPDDGFQLVGWQFVGGTTNTDPVIASTKLHKMQVGVLDLWGGAWTAEYRVWPQDATWQFRGGIFTDLGLVSAAPWSLAGRAANGDMWWYNTSGAGWTWAGRSGIPAGGMAVTAP